MALYWLVLLVSCAVALRKGTRAPREGVVGAAVFATLCLSAIRWDVIPVRGLGIITLVAILGGTFLWRLYQGAEGEPLQKGAVGYLLVLVAMLVLLLAGSIRLAAPMPGFAKSINFALWTVAGAATLTLFGRLTARDASAAGSALLLGAVLAALAVLSSGRLLVERGSVSESTNPITVARIIGFGVVVAFTRAVTAPPGALRRLLGYGLTGLLLLLAGMLTGSRGPFLATVLGLAVTTLLIPGATSARSTRFIRVAATAAIATFLLAGLAQSLSALGGIARITKSLASIGTHRTERQRIEYYERAAAVVPEDGILGRGPDYFRVVSNGRTLYPHNVALEIAIESGIPGIIVGALMVLIPLVALVLRTRREPLSTDELALVAIWLASLVNAQVSGDVSTNYNAWITGMLVVLLHRLPKAGHVHA